MTTENRLRRTAKERIESTSDSENTLVVVSSKNLDSSGADTCEDMSKDLTVNRLAKELVLEDMTNSSMSNSSFEKMRKSMLASLGPTSKSRQDLLPSLMEVNAKLKACGI